MRRPCTGRRTDPRSVVRLYTRAEIASAAERAVMTLSAGAPSYQFRADTVTLSAGNVATIPNRRGSDALVVAAGTLAAPAGDALFGGAQSIVFSGTQWLDSNLAASAWKFLHDGTGCEEFHVLAMTSVAATQVIAATRDNAVSIGRSTLNIAGGTVGSRVTTAGSPAISTNAAGTLSANTACIINHVFGSTSPINFTGFVNATAATALAQSATPDPGSPQGTLRLGADRGAALPASMRWCETLIFPRVLHEYERQIVREYIAARYGIAAPSLTGADRDIMSMLPFSWPRFDSYTTSAGLVTSILDKARPGHTFAQGTSANQVSNPVASANFNGQLTATFAAAKNYSSSLAATAWSFLHAVSEIYTPFRATSFGTTQIAWETQVSSANGLLALISSTSGDVALASYRPGVQSATNLTGNVINISRLYQWRAGVTSLEQKATGLGSSSVVIPAGTLNAAAKTPQFSGRSTSLGLVGEVPELGLVFNRVLTAAERARVEAYYFSRYALVA